MEFVIPGRETQYREQIRFIRKLDQDKFEPVIQNVIDFNSTMTSDVEKGWIFEFCRLPFNYERFDKSGLNGFKITGQTLDIANRKIMIQFERPLDVSYDYSFYLEPEGDYKIFL